MKRSLPAMLLFGALSLAATMPLSGQSATRRPHLVVVQMVDKSATQFAFSPAQVTVHPGDTLRFVQTGPIPHNVQFKKRPKGADLGGTMMGPFLLKKGETYDVVIDKRFVLGRYDYVCTPHELLGMKATILVERTAPIVSPHAT